MPYLARVSFAEKKSIAVVNQAPQETTFENLRGVCMGICTFKYPYHDVEGTKHNEVIPGLILGEGPLGPEKLQKLGVARVLELGAKRNVAVTDNCRNPYKDLSIKYKAVQLDDTPTAPIECHFQGCANFIERGLRSGSVYVFSPFGSSRPATIIAAFLMLKKGQTGVDALRSVHIRKPVRPNDGFLQQLVKLHHERKNFQTRMKSHLEVSMECECAKAKPLYAPNVHYRDPKNYSMSVLGKNRQQIAQRMYFQSSDATKTPITHDVNGKVKPIIFKVL